jgi:type II secretory pathway pseudopilin PulG
MEMLVVLVILVILVALIVPLIVGVADQAHSATNANVLQGVNRAVQTFNAQYGKLPDTWDYVLDENDQPYKLHPNVAPLVKVHQLTADQVKSLNEAGMVGGHYQDSAYPGHPHESIKGWKGYFTQPKVLALIKPATFSGHYVDFPDRAFGINKFKAEAFKSEYVVLGLAATVNIKGNGVTEIPVIQSAEPTKYYARVLGVFRVPDTSTQAYFKAQYIGCFAPDGTCINDNVDRYHESKVPLN